MKLDYSKILVILSIVVFIAISSCSDDKDEQKDVYDTDNFFSLTVKQRQAYWLNSKHTCSSGWSIYPYKSCSLKDDEAKNYKKSKFSTCEIESEKHECRACRHKNFGIESTKTILTDNVIKNYPMVINVFAPYTDKNSIIKADTPAMCGNVSKKEFDFIQKQVFPRFHDNLKFDPLADITAYCKSKKSELIKELEKKYPEHTIIVNFVSGFFKSSDDNQVIQPHMLDIIRRQRLKPVLERTVMKNDFNKFTFATNMNIYASCNYIWEIQKNVYAESKDCNICGSIDEIKFSPCRECGFDEKTIIKATKYLTKQDVEQIEGKALGCMSCDDISFDILNMDEKNQDSFMKKKQCLQNNLNNISLDDNITRFYIIRELNRLKKVSSDTE